MDEAKDIVGLLNCLVPGLLAAWVFYGLTPHRRLSAFERIIQALIFTLFVQAGLVITQSIAICAGNYVRFGAWNDEVVTIWSAVLGLAFGTTLAWIANSNRLHELLQRNGITRQTSYPSEWYGVLSNSESYLVLHLQDEKRISGWPKEWPLNPDEGHFYLIHAMWFDGDSDIPLDGTEGVLIPATQVRYVEVLDRH